MDLLFANQTTFLSIVNYLYSPSNIAYMSALGDVWSRHEERVRGWVGGMDWAVRGRNRLDADYSVTIRKHGVKSVIKRC